MLELRPICENCAKPLPPNSPEARICSFECTFCADCVENVLDRVCPNCGGDFVPRPIRPARNWRGDNYLGRYPATEAKRHRPVDPEAHRQLLAKIAGRLPPAETRGSSSNELFEAMDRGQFDLDLEAIDRLNDIDSDPSRDR